MFGHACLQTSTRLQRLASITSVQHNYSTRLKVQLYPSETVAIGLQVGCPASGLDEAVARLTAAGYKVRHFENRGTAVVRTPAHV